MTDTLAPDQRDDRCDRDPRFRFARVNLQTQTTTYDCRRFVGRSVFLEAIALWNREGLTRTDGPLWAYYEVFE